MKFKTHFMIFLILCLPFYIGSVYAITPDRFPGELKEIRVYGDMNQTKALRPDSRFYVDVIVAKTNLSPSRLTFTEGQTFNTCVPHPDGSICSLILTPPTELAEGIKDYTITYFPPVGTPYSLTGSYVVDGTPPEVTTFRVTPSIVGGGELSIFYTAIDYSDSPVFCAGIGGFEIASDTLFQNIIADVKIEVDSIDDCVKSGTISVAAPTQTGEYTWYGRAYDRLGNFAYSFMQTTFEVDADPPEILIPRLYKQGAEVNYTDVGTSEYELRVEIKDEHGLEGTPTLDIASGAGSCIPLGPTSYECIWPVIVTTTSTTRTISGTITAEDTVGNSISKEISVGIGIDEDAPIIAFFGSEYGNYIRAEDNTLRLHAVEQESGFDETTVYADLHLMNPAYGTERHPDECDNEWCYWYDIDCPRSEGTYSARVYISDFLGHQSYSDTDFILDKTPPVINEIIHDPLFPTSEDLLVFVLNISDNSGIFRATANISDISTYDGLLEGECFEEGDDFICVFEAIELKTYAAFGNILFNVTDLGGNNVAEEYQMVLFEAELDAIPNEIDVNVGQILPSEIPKEIALSIPTKLFLGLDVHYKTDDTEIIDRGQPNCVGLQQLNLLPNYGTDNPYWIGTNYMVFVIKLDNATAALSNIELNCTVDFIIRKRTKIFYNPEREQIFANVSLKSIMTIDDDLVDKVEGIEHLVMDQMEWVQTTDEILQYMRNICDSFEVFKDVYDFLQTLKPALYGILSLIYAFPWGKSAANSAWKYYNVAVCYMAVAKNYAWPNTNPRNIGTYNQEQGATGVFEKWEGTRGWVRNICAIVKCRQCNTDWSIANRLANFNFAEYDPNATGTSTTLNDRLNTTVFSQVDLSVSVDPFKSWAVSLACLCLPGLIHNAKKYRQLECMHARCLIENAKRGQSTDFCDKAHERRTCVFWWGGLLHLVPGWLFMKMISSKLKEVLANLPARFVIAIRDKLCDLYDRSIGTSGPAATQAGRAQDAKDCKKENMPDIPNPKNTQFILCTLFDTAMLIWAWDDMIDNAFDSERYKWDEDETDYCEEVDWDAIDTLEG